jgi:Astacin (Peptidase family M12A)
MKSTSIVATALATALAAALAASAASAGDPPFSARIGRDFMPDAFRAEQAEVMALMKTLASDEASRGAFYPLFVWPPSIKKLKVCFFGGSEEARAAIRELASDWEQPDNSLRFDWGKNGYRDCEKVTQKRLIHIRVGFAEPGYFSAIGTMSGFRPDTTELSMNLEGLGDKSAAEIKEGWTGGTVRHEFGHAIGLIHEHQSPKADCEKDFDWDKIYEAASKPPNEWPKDKVDSNMRQWTDPDLFTTKFDATSVMKYFYDPSMFKNGTDSACYSATDNNAISPLDRKTVAFMYPPSEQARLEKFESNRAAFAALLDKAEEAGTSKGPREDLLEKYFSRKKNSGTDDSI